METAPPAWLRSYKAHSAMIPNYACQVRTEVDSKPTTKAPPEKQLSSRENIAQLQNTDIDDNTVADPFTFPSTISLTLHNVVSLDKSYSNSTPDPSPKKPAFNRGLDEEAISAPTAPNLRDHPANRRRGPLCRFLAAVRRMLASKTQHKLVH
ncbi:MAG: hypothetical protein Q9166_000935 [cf. Caloplaca sp. 2 TL-2023]